MLDLGEQYDATAEGIELVKDMRRTFNDLRIEGFDGVLDDMTRQLEMRQVVIVCKLDRQERQMNDELRREYERGLL